MSRRWRRPRRATIIGSLGPGSIDALEIGNEPNVYGKITVDHTVFGLPVAARPSNFAYPAYRRQFRSIAAAAPQLTLAGPGAGDRPHARARLLGGIDAGLSQAAAAAGDHDRPPLSAAQLLRAAEARRSTPRSRHLLSSYAINGLAASLARWVAIAHRRHRQLRVDELNSVACRGKAGVSDTFASALWVTDALFALAHAGVDGINMHTLPDAAYELFVFSRRGGRWQATVRPVYYGLDLFARAAPAGARLLPLARRGHATGLSGWATRAPDGTVRVVVINKDPAAKSDGRDQGPRSAPAPPSSGCWLPASPPAAASRSGAAASARGPPPASWRRRGPLHSERSPAAFGWRCRTEARPW